MLRTTADEAVDHQCSCYNCFQWILLKCDSSAKWSKDGNTSTGTGLGKTEVRHECVNKWNPQSRMQVLTDISAHLASKLLFNLRPEVVWIKHWIDHRLLRFLFCSMSLLRPHSCHIFFLILYSGVVPWSSRFTGKQCKCYDSVWTTWHGISKTLFDY